MAKMIFIAAIVAVAIISLIVFIYKRMNKYNPQREDSGTVVFLTGVFLAGMGIVAFWVFGFSDKEAQALYAFLFAGMAATVALAAKGIHYLRYRNMY